MSLFIEGKWLINIWVLKIKKYGRGIHRTKKVVFSYDFEASEEADVVETDGFFLVIWLFKFMKLGVFLLFFKTLQSMVVYRLFCFVTLVLWRSQSAAIVAILTIWQWSQPVEAISLALGTKLFDKDFMIWLSFIKYFLQFNPAFSYKWVIT